ncbi:MAG: hypothetical protein ACPG37_06655 [Luminiphilus sp.]
MQHLVSPSGAEKRALRDAIEQEVQQFLNRGGEITVLRSPPADADRYRGCLWHDGGDDSGLGDQ